MTISNILSRMGDAIFYLALITYASRLKEYSLIISLIAISETFPQLVGSFFGYLADKAQNKYSKILLFAWIRTALYALVGLLFASSLSAWSIVMLTILINLVSDLFGNYTNALKTPLIRLICTDDEMEAAMGISASIGEIIQLISQFIGTGLLLFLSYSGLAYLNAFSFLLSGLVLLRLKDIQRLEKTHPNLLAQNNYRNALTQSIKTMNREPALFKTVFQLALVNAILSTSIPLLEIKLVNTHELIIQNYSFTIAIIGALTSAALALGGSIGIALFKKTTLKNMILAILCFILTFLLTLPFKQVLITYGSLSIVAFLTGTASPKLSAWLMKSVDTSVLSSSVGLINTILITVTPIVTILFSIINSTFSLKIATFFIVILTVIALLLTFMKEKRLIH